MTRFYVLFNSISVISGRWADGNEMLCAMELRLQLRRFRLKRGSNSGSTLFREANGRSQKLFLFLKLVEKK